MYVRCELRWKKKSHKCQFARFWTKLARVTYFSPENDIRFNGFCVVNWRRGKNSSLERTYILLNELASSCYSIFHVPALDYNPFSSHYPLYIISDLINVRRTALWRTYANDIDVSIFFSTFRFLFFHLFHLVRFSWFSLLRNLTRR